MRGLIEEGEFVNRADIITASLRFWLEYRHYDIRTALTDLLRTTEGQRILRAALRKKGA